MLGGYGMWGDGGVLSTLFLIVVLVDLTLLGFWLWKQVQK